MEAIQALFHLRWRTQEPKIRPLPPHVRRTFVPTAKGNLELLVCEPKNSPISAESPSIFFVHGGYGCAGVWLEWMNYLYAHEYPGRIYAYSARNHGASYAVSYLQMVFSTSLLAIADDLATCVKHAENLNADDRRMVMVAHSAGGGVSQYALANGLIHVRGLCLVDAVPHYGMADLYWNWFKHDPWFPLRSLLHLGHPSSPLSTPRLVYGAFFGPKFPVAQVSAFMQWMPSYESMGWPIGQFGSLWSWLHGHNTWLSVESILKRVECSKSTAPKDKLCVMVGSEDMMYCASMYERVAKEYRDAICDLGRDRKIYDAARGRGQDDMWGDADRLSLSRAEGVRVVVVHGAGHHVQNDIQSNVAAKALQSWVSQG